MIGGGKTGCQICLPAAPADAANIRGRIFVICGGALGIIHLSFWPSSRLMLMYSCFTAVSLSLYSQSRPPFVAPSNQATVSVPLLAWFSEATAELSTSMDVCRYLSVVSILECPAKRAIVSMGIPFACSLVIYV